LQHNKKNKKTLYRMVIKYTYSSNYQSFKNFFFNYIMHYQRTN